MNPEENLEILLFHANRAGLNNQVLDLAERTLSQTNPDYVLVDEYAFNTKDVIENADKLSALAQEYGCGIILATDDKHETIVDTERLRKSFEEQKKHAEEGNFYFSLTPSFTIQLSDSCTFEEFLDQHYHRKDDGKYYESDGSRRWVITREELENAGISYEDVSDKHIRRIWEDKAYKKDIVKEPDSDGNLHHKAVRGEFIGSDYSKEDFEADSVGFYFSKDGKIHAFPKQWEDSPYHKIPGNDDVTISICGEINSLTPEDIAEFKILLNPSREGDDPYISARMRYQEGESLESLTDEYPHIKGEEDQLSKPSPYFERVHEEAMKRGVLAVRVDLDHDASGTLCLPKNYQLEKYEKGEGYSLISLRKK